MREKTFFTFRTASAFLALLLFLLSFAVITAHAQGYAGKVNEFALSNGMRFFVYERPQIPTFAGMISVQVGTHDQRTGEGRLVHFVEHMAFKGTPVIGTRDYAKEKLILDEMDLIGDELAGEYSKLDRADEVKIKALKDKLRQLQEEHRKFVVTGEFTRIYTENGGHWLNAMSGPSSTVFFVMLPSNRLELWFLLESERFKNPVFRELYSELDVIANEVGGWDENPYWFLWSQFQSVAFHLHPFFNSSNDYYELLRLTKEKVLNFYKTFYIPNNMVAILVGDVKLEQVKGLAEKYFGDFPMGKDPPRHPVVEPQQRGEYRVTVRFDFDPILMIGYHMPIAYNKDNLILGLINMILSRGSSSRLRRDLVTNRKIASDITITNNYPPSRYASLFFIQGYPQHPHTPEELEKAIYEHLDRLKDEPVKPEELERVINISEADLYRYGSSNDNLYRARRLVENIDMFDDVDGDFKRFEKMKKITAAEIMAAANKYFTESNRIVGILLPKEKGDGK